VHQTRLATTAPFDANGLFRYLAGHAIPGVETANHERYERVGLSIEADGADGILLRTDGVPELGTVARARQLMNLDADSRLIDAQLTSDPRIAHRVVASPGIRLPGALDAHEQLFRTLVGQQISISATRTVLGRLARELCGETGRFPSAHQIAARGREVLRGPAGRVETILRVAEALASGELVVSHHLTVEELTDRLSALKGIGPWTAGYVSMRVLGAPDVLLTTDLVLLKGADRLGLPSTPRALAEYGQRWAPFRSYAGLHLWRAAQERQ